MTGAVEERHVVRRAERVRDLLARERVRYVATERGPYALASEPELDLLFPDCERGALPPFGELYGLDMYVDACLPRAREVFFPAGSRHQLLGMPYAEYARVARPHVGQLCFHREG